jgi:hypothetical protein
MGQNPRADGICSSARVGLVPIVNMKALTSRVNPACDALRAAILAVGGVHLRHERYSNDQKAALKVNRASTAKVLELVRQVIDNQATRPLQKEDIEFIVAALLSCTVASVRLLMAP